MPWFRGDLHVHSNWRDGGLTPPQLAAAAHVVGLDFLAATEHDRAAATAEWPTGPDTPLVIAGEEVTTGHGHWLAVGLPVGMVVEGRGDPLDGERLRQCLEQIHGTGGITVVAHPHAPAASHRAGFAYDGFDLVEVWNGAWTSSAPWQADNEAALSDWAAALATDVPTGRWRPAVGNSDTHLIGQIGTPQTVVQCNDLSVRSILAAAKSGRCWIAESAAVDVALTTSNGERSAGIGERLEPGAGAVKVNVRVRVPRRGRVAARGDDEVVATMDVAADDAAEFTFTTSASDTAYVRLEIRDDDGSMMAMTNPITLR